MRLRRPPRTTSSRPSTSAAREQWLPDPPPEGKKTPTEKLTAWLDKYGATYPAPTFDGSALACGDDVSIEVLIAGHDTKPGEPFKKSHNERKNNASIVLKVERDGFGIILAGDAYDAAEKAILATGADIEAEVLKLGHHGAAKSSSVDWIKAVQPEHVIATAGQNGTYGHPRCDVLDRFTSQPLATASTHPVECFVARDKPWEHRDLSVSVWNACETGHVRLTVGDAAQYTLSPHVFPQDKAGNGAGEKCPVRFAR